MKKRIGIIIMCMLIIMSIILFREIRPYKEEVNIPDPISIYSGDTTPLISNSVNNTYHVNDKYISNVSYRIYRNNDTTQLITESVNDMYNVHITPPTPVIIDDVNTTKYVVEPTYSIPVIPDCPLSEYMQEYIYNLSVEYDVPYELVMAVIRTESNFEPTACSGSSHGLMQIHRINAQYAHELGVDDLYDPAGNVLVGVTILSDLLKRHTITDALTCYNIGEYAAEQKGMLGKPSKYSTKVWGYYSEYISANN